MKSNMTEKQQRFLAEYRKDFNGAAAARRMGYTGGSARSMAYRFLRQPEIRQALQDALEAPQDDPVIAELRRLAFSEGSDANGAEVKLSSKLKALELLGKHLGLFDPAAQKPPTPVTIIEDCK